MNKPQKFILMKKLHTIFLIISLILFGNINAQTILANDANIDYMGRIDFSNELEPTYSFPGITIKAKFNGTGISATIHDYGTGGVKNTNYYKVIIDGDIYTEHLEMSNGEQTYTLAENLTLADHTVELIKISEGTGGRSSFLGFTIIGGDQSLLSMPNWSDKKIEFIGDSWTCGFGNLSQYATGPASMANGDFVARNQDNYFAWGPITARNLGAEYHVTAISGRGLYRNNTGSKNGTLPLNYDNIFEDDNTVSYDHTSWQPDVVVIHLGTNDLAQEEGGRSYKLDDAAFEQTYFEFVGKILTYHPCANVIICFGNSKTDAWPTWTKQLTRLRTMANGVVSRFPNGNVTTLELPFTAEKYTGNKADDCGYGDAWHPSLCSHEEMSVKLTAKINQMDVVWNSPKGCSSYINSSEEVKQNTITISPNPAQDYINLTVDANEPLLNSNNYLWTIYSLNGTKVDSGNGSLIQISNLTSGLYFVQVNYNNKIITAKFIKE